MESKVDITNQQWADLNKQVSQNEKDIDYLVKRSDRHKKRLDDLEDAHIALPLEIQNAITTSLAPISTMFKEMFKELSEENKELRIKVEDLEKEKYKKSASTLEWLTRGAGAAVLVYVITKIAEAIWN